MLQQELRRNFILTNAYFKKMERSQINNLNLHLKKLEKEYTKPKVSRGKEITKITLQISKTETRKAIEKINQT